MLHNALKRTAAFFETITDEEFNALYELDTKKTIMKGYYNGYKLIPTETETVASDYELALNDVRKFFRDVFKNINNRLKVNQDIMDNFSTTLNAFDPEVLNTTEILSIGEISKRFPDVCKDPTCFRILASPPSETLAEMIGSVTKHLMPANRGASHMASISNHVISYVHAGSTADAALSDLPDKIISKLSAINDNLFSTTIDSDPRKMSAAIKYDCHKLQIRQARRYTYAPNKLNTRDRTRRITKAAVVERGNMQTFLKLKEKAAIIIKANNERQEQDEGQSIIESIRDLEIREQLSADETNDDLLEISNCDSDLDIDVIDRVCNQSEATHIASTDGSTAIANQLSDGDLIEPIESTKATPDDSTNINNDSELDSDVIDRVCNQSEAANIASFDGSTAIANPIFCDNSIEPIESVKTTSDDSRTSNNCPVGSEPVEPLLLSSKKRTIDSSNTTLIVEKRPKKTRSTNQDNSLAMLKSTISTTVKEFNLSDVNYIVCKYEFKEADGSDNFVTLTRNDIDCLVPKKQQKKSGGISYEQNYFNGTILEFIVNWIIGLAQNESRIINLEFLGNHDVTNAFPSSELSIRSTFNWVSLTKTEFQSPKSIQTRNHDLKQLFHNPNPIDIADFQHQIMRIDQPQFSDTNMLIFCQHAASHFTERSLRVVKQSGLRKLVK